MEAEKEAIRKPPFWFTIQLFIFMMLIIVDIWSLLENFNSSWLDNLNGYAPSYIISLGIIDVALYIYALLSIYKSLQHKPNSIFMLRLSVFYVFIQFIFKYFSDTPINPLQKVIKTFILIYGIVFFIYLFKSKGIKNFIPKAERTVGIYGAIGLLLYVAILPLYAYPSYKTISMVKRSKSKPIKKIRLANNTFNDGLTKFVILRDWHVDTIVSKKEGHMFLFSRGYEKHNIMIMSFNAECHSRIDFCQLLSNTGDMVLQDKDSLIEVNYGNITINGNKCFYDSYKLSYPHKQYKYWTYAALADESSYKVIGISYLSNDWRAGMIQINTFMKSVNFKLE